MVPNSRARGVVTYWPSVSEGYQQAIQEALSGQQPVDQALADGQALIDAAKNNKLTDYMIIISAVF